MNWIRFSVLRPAEDTEVLLAYCSAEEGFHYFEVVKREGSSYKTFAVVHPYSERDLEHSFWTYIEKPRV